MRSTPRYSDYRTTQSGQELFRTGLSRQCSIEQANSEGILSQEVALYGNVPRQLRSRGLVSLYTACGAFRSLQPELKIK